MPTWKFRHLSPSDKRLRTYLAIAGVLISSLSSASVYVSAAPCSFSVDLLLPRSLRTSLHASSGCHSTSCRPVLAVSLLSNNLLGHPML